MSAAAGKLLANGAADTAAATANRLPGGDVELVFVPEPEHEQRAEDRNDDPGRMKLRARLGTRKDVRHESPDNRTNDPEPDRPQKRQVHVHDRFRTPPRDQTNDDVPNQMKHDDVSSFKIGIDRQAIRAT